MPKKYIGYLIGLILLAIAILYGYYKWSQAQEKVNLWSLVPDDAVFIIETNRHQKFIQELRRTNLWENVSRLPFLLNLEENIQLLDSAAVRRVKLNQFLYRKRILTSIHVTGKNDFDFILYVPVSSVSEHRYIRNVVENVGKSTSFETSVQEYQGYEITNIVNKLNRDSFAFFTYRNNIILSPKPFLLQQVIRKLNRARLESPIKEFRRVNYLKQKNVYANIFVNYRHLAPFLNIFFKPGIQDDIDYYAGLCSKSLLGLHLEAQELFLEGVSQRESLLGSFSQQVGLQQPQKFRLQALIPERTAVLIYFGGQQLAGLSISQQLTVVTESPSIHASVDSLRHSFQKELAVCYLASAIDSVASEKVVLAFTPRPDKTNRFLQEINAVNNVSFPVERAGRYRVQEIGLPELPSQLFGKGFTGFPGCFAAQVDSFLVFAPNEVILRRFLQDIRDKEVWQNAPDPQAILRQSFTGTNFSVFLNMQNAWAVLNKSVNEDKKVGLLRHERLFKKFNLVSLQFARQQNQYATRLLLHHQPEGTPALKTEPQFTIEQELNFPEPVITGLNLLPNQPTPRNELFVQDSSLVLHRLTAEGTISWSDSLDSKIAGKVLPITFGTGTQPKYAFATQNRIYCLDQNGDDMENFPFNLSDTININGLTVLDRGNVLKHHFLVNDEKGNFYLFDAQGNILPGWDPKEMPGKLATDPYYIKIKGREVLIMLLQNGYVYALDANGMNYPGFPINLQGTFSAPLILQAGGNFRNTTATSLTDAGELITFNLSGEIEKRVAFARPSRRTTFQLILENSGKSFLIARQDLGRVILYDASQKSVM